MEVEVIIPKLDNDGSDNAAHIEGTIAMFCDLFGGATVFEAAGFWKDAEGTLYRDAVSVIASDTTRNDACDDLLALARDLLAVTDQKAVYVSIDGKAEIVE